MRLNISITTALFLLLMHATVTSTFNRWAESSSTGVTIRRVKRKDPLPDYCFESQTSNERRKKRSSVEFSNSTASPRSTNDDFESSENGTKAPDLSRFSKEFLSCVHVMIEHGCYEFLSNGSVYMPVFNKALNQSDFFISNDKNLYICHRHMRRPDGGGKFDQTFAVLSQVGIGISLACIILHMIMFALVPAMRNLPGYSLFSLCVSLLKAYACYFARDLIEEESSCSDLGMLMFYFFLASFFWMNVLSYDVWRSLRMATCKLRIPTRMWLRFAMYSLYAWGAPALIVVVALIIDQLADVDFSYKLIFREETCWFAYKQALLVYFAAPLFTLLFLNLVCFVWSLVMITSASMQNVENRDVFRTRLCIFSRLFIIMGLTWIFGVAAAATQWIGLWYLFAIFNTSQGVLIFFSFSCGEKTKKAWKSRLRGRKISSTPTTQSSFHSQNAVNSTTV